MDFDWLQEKINSLEKITDLSFDMLYYMRVSKEDLLKIRGKCIQNEEYEKVMIIDKMIEIKWYALDTIWETLDTQSHLINELDKVAQEILMLITTASDSNLIQQKSSDVLKLVDKVITNTLDSRISRISSRLINPFKESKFQNMFECFRSEAIFNLQKLKNRMVAPLA